LRDDSAWNQLSNGTIGMFAWR